MKEDIIIEQSGDAKQQEAVPADLYHFKGQITPAHAKALKKDLQMAERVSDDRIKQHFKRLNPNQRNQSFADAGIKPYRTTVQADVFWLYLMSNHNMDFMEARTILPGHPQYEKLVTGYLKFIETHPITESAEKDPEKRARNSVEIADMYMGAAKK